MQMKKTKEARYLKAINDYKSARLSNVELAMRHGVSPATITYWVKKAGLSLRHPGRRPLRQPNRTHRQIIELAQHQTYEETGRKFGLSRQRVHYIIKRWEGDRPRKSELSATLPGPGDIREKKGEVISFRLSGKQVSKVQEFLQPFGVNGIASNSRACRAVLLMVLAGCASTEFSRLSPDQSQNNGLNTGK
jgi:hypothetical protein